jgi:hypothetical protein
LITVPPQPQHTMKSSLHSLIPFLSLFSNSFDCRLSQFYAATDKYGDSPNSIPLQPSSYPGRLASRNSINSSQLNSSLQSLHTDQTENTVYKIPYCCVFTDPLLRKGFFYCCVRIRCRGNVFTDPLTRNGLHNTVVCSPIA